VQAHKASRSIPRVQARVLRLLAGFQDRADQIADETAADGAQGPSACPADGRPGAVEDSSGVLRRSLVARRAPGAGRPRRR